MTGTHLQSVSDDDLPIEQYSDPGASAGWEDGGVEGPNKGLQQLQRYGAAMWRFKWLIVLCGILGTAGGVMATRLIQPEYEVQSTILLSEAKPRSERSAADGFQQAGLLDLLQSFQVVDPVVEQLALFVEPAVVSDSAVFRDFGIADGVIPGDYTLRISGNRYELVLNGSRQVENGALGDAIGTPVGFAWQPPATALIGREVVEFTIRTPREKSIALIRRLEVPKLRAGSNILTVRLRGADAQKTEATLNMWAESFVAVATSYKKFGATQRADILEGQLEYARQELAQAEGALQTFKIRTAELPSESRMPQVAGTDVTANPIFNSFFSQQVTSDQLRRDRAAIERALTAGADGGVSIEGLLSVPSVNGEQAATKLRADLEQALRAESELRDLRQRYTDIAPQVRVPLAAYTQLRDVVIPASARALVEQLSQREADLGVRLAEQSRDLQDIPRRTMDLLRLQRAVDVADDRYRSLLVQASEARVAEVTTPPDIDVLDSAVAPLRPTKNTGPVVIAGAIAAALGLGLVLAILLDTLDKRFRYPQQATDELGLFILGVIPNINRSRRRSTEDASQMVEAFRTIRMNMRYAVDPSRPFAVTISSPGPNDGKSLVSSNLALSFADGGSRVILVDGDIRRGELQETFKVSGKPGLVDYLDGTALLPEVLRDTNHPNLTLLPCGKRQRRAPELLTGPRLTQLVAQLKREYDVVIIDSPPLGAGSDAYTLGIAAENLVVVLRSGITDRKMASAKLRTVETLPIRVLGSVLNGIKMTGVYQYYSYYLDYEAKDEDQVKALPSSSSPRAAVVKAAGD